MAKRKGSLLRQLTLGLGLAIIFITLVSFYYQYQVQRNVLIRNTRANLLQQASQIAAWLGQHATQAERQEVAARNIAMLDQFNPTKRELTIVDHEGKVLASNMKIEPGTLFTDDLLAKALAPGGPRDGLWNEVGGFSIIAFPCFAAPAARPAGAVYLKQPLVTVETLANNLMLTGFALVAVTLLIMILVVYGVLRIKVHRPIQAIFMQEYRIREGDLAKIEAEDPRNEFSDLYAMYNEMVTRIAEQKRAILDQKDHMALAQLVRQAMTRLTGPLDDILTRSRSLLDSQASLSAEDKKTLNHILTSVTRIVRELKSIVVEGDKSAGMLRREADKIRQYSRGAQEGGGPE